MAAPDLLRDWRTLNAPAALNGLSEQEVSDLIQAEVAGRARHQFLLRLHQRYTTLRAERERAELLAQAKAP